MDAYSLLDRLQSDLHGRLLADELLSDVPVLLETRGLTESDVATALTTLNERADGKLGLVAIVLMPQVDTESTGGAPIFTVRPQVRVIETPLINRDEGGVGITNSMAGLRIIHALHGYIAHGIAQQVTVADQAMAPAEGLPDGNVGVDVFFRMAGGVDLPRKVLTPRIEQNGGQVSMHTGTASAEIRFTTDSVYPRPDADGSTLYTTPVTLDPGTLIRAVGYRAGFLASDAAAFKTQ